MTGVQTCALPICIIGRIVKIGEGYVGLEVADGKVIHLQRQAVTTLLPKGTFNDVTK